MYGPEKGDSLLLVPILRVDGQDPVRILERRQKAKIAYTRFVPGTRDE